MARRLGGGAGSPRLCNRAYFPAIYQGVSERGGPRAGVFVRYTSHCA
ncbi:hypothetical protein I549_0960 [Mycobacterium avium subsp. avium 2285 (R)]|nr:hypothetical protein I549_0960 [Mycobacterium avium subsp. avium 2285 (R)]